MNYRSLIAKGYLKKENISFEQINKVLNLIYGAGFSVSKTESKNAIQSARKLIDKIEEVIQKKNPQKRLFKQKAKS